MKKSRTKADRERRIVIEQAVRMCLAVVLPRINQGKPLWADHAHGAVMGFLAGRMVNLSDGMRVAAQITRAVLEGRYEKYYFTRCRNCGTHPVPMGPWGNCTACGEDRPVEGRPRA